MYKPFLASLWQVWTFAQKQKWQPAFCQVIKLIKDPCAKIKVCVCSICVWSKCINFYCILFVCTLTGIYSPSPTHRAVNRRSRTPEGCSWWRTSWSLPGRSCWGTSGCAEQSLHLRERKPTTGQRSNVSSDTHYWESPLTHTSPVQPSLTIWLSHSESSYLQGHFMIISVTKMSFFQFVIVTDQSFWHSRCESWLSVLLK